MQIIYRWISLLALLAFAGCYTEPQEEPDIIVTLEPEFIVDLFEQRDPADGTAQFGLWVESMAIFDCSNYQLSWISQFYGSDIKVQLLDITSPDTCLGASGPVSRFIPIGQLADGSYTFTLSLNSLLVNKGILTVQNGHYELSLPEQKGIDFQNRVLETLPDAYLWGYADTPAEQDLPVADQLVQNLKNRTDAPLLPPGFYSYFTVSGSGLYFFHRSIAPAGQHLPFLRRFGSSTALEVRNLLQGYRNDPVRPLSVRCLSTLGTL